MDDKNRKKPNLGGIEPPKSYLDSLTDFAALLGTINRAEKAAGELNRELTRDAHMNDAPAVKMPVQTATAEPPEAQAQAEPKKLPTMDELLAELDRLVGLTDIKDSVRSMINLVKVRRLRQEAELPVPPMSLHMVFTGNPGTGKTTVARIMAGLLREIGVLTKGHLVETDRGGLVAGYVGQTALKTTEVAKSAFGGILFIDEAYALTPPGAENDFGREAVETLLKLMEDNRDDFIVIVAGYDELMGNFISSNPGLESRFNRYFAFPDYNSDELLAIFEGLCEKNEYSLDDETKRQVKLVLDAMYLTRGDNFGNARDVRNFFEDIVAVHADRLAEIENPTRELLSAFVKEDVEAAAERG